MFKKIGLKKEINECKKQINELESKRARSQAALVQALLNQEHPDDDDVEYFNKFTQQIDELRDKMHGLMAQLSSL